MKRHRIVSIAVVCLALLGLFWLLDAIGWTKVLWHLRSVGLTGVLLLFAIGMIEALLDAFALKVATLANVSFWRVIFVNQAGSLMNSIVPGDTGEILKASLLAKNAPGRGVPGAVVWNVAFRLSKSVIILLAAGLALILLPSHVREASLMLGLGCIGILIYIALDLIIQRQWLGRILSFLGRWSVFRRPRVTKFIEQAVEIEKRSADFRHHHPRRYFAILVLQGGARLADISLLVMALRFLGLDYGIPLCLLIFAGLQLLSYLLPLFPTRIGTTEGSTYLLFVFLGLDGGLGAIFQVLQRVIKLTVSTVCVLAYILSQLTFKLRRPLATASNIAEPE